MITYENIEIIHYFLQVDKAPFEEMLAQLLAEYKAIHTPVRIVIFDAPVDNEEYVARFACIRKAVKELFKEKTTFRKLCGTTSSEYGIGDGSA